MTAQHTVVPKHVAIDRAMGRFLLISGSGQGMKFYDPATQRELTIHNRVNWVNQRINTDESAGWQELSHKRWLALLPRAEYRPNEKPVFALEPGLFVKNIWAAPEIDPDEKGDPTFFDKSFVHLHVPEGATPKDGPSAGITMATALLSIARKEAPQQNLAMTGELTLTGQVLPVGGIREKVIAARRQKINNLILPEANRGDYEELPDYLKEGISVSFAKHYNDVFQVCFGNKPKQGSSVH